LRSDINTVLNDLKNHVKCNKKIKLNTKIANQLYQND